MQTHRGLPKNLPQRRNKARIFSPAKNIHSPAGTDQRSKPGSKTPRKSTPSSESKHRLKSKQKPDLNPPTGSKKKNNIPSVLIKQFDHRQTEAPKPQQTQFMQTVLGMMGKLNKKAQEAVHSDVSKVLQQKKYQEIRSSRNFEDKSASKFYNANPKTCPLLYRQRPIQHPGESPDEELLARCAAMLKNPSNWLNYCGQQKQNMRTGYGILYFKNKDKFMGGFKQNKAHGHGTYYFNDLKKRIMAIWSSNEIMLSNGCMVENLQSK